MKKFNVVLLILLMVLSLSGCKLAKEETVKNPAYDTLVGGFVQFIEYGKEKEIKNIEDVKIEVKGKDTNKYIEVDGAEGYAFLAIATIDLENSYSTSETIASPCIEASADYKYEEGQSRFQINLKGKIYIDAETKGSLKLYPIYLTDDNKYYIGKNKYVFGLDLDGNYFQNFEEGNYEKISISENFNNKLNKKEQSNTVELEVKKILRKKEIKIIEMDKNNNMLNIEKFNYSNLPYRIEINSNTEYILLEETTDKNLIERKIINYVDDELEQFRFGDNTVTFPIFNNGNIAEIKNIKIEKDI
ncbi:hypothetical protein [Miniphocaeibacter halophilus]|uniref:Uncharacterized protein n=1 Tax=Miniphocaeibacter halophilus TaxID=2931922 RepID=A0AC61MSE3_9FIRM|nr:hypothetical protein [Miniphocaeibacter halophilus]QQK07351.1 hypothetical protein JFY71_08495 [Miniphocaeibacter halophilus]